MRNILRKEFKLSASVLSYLFIIAALLFLTPGYPVLCGAFFVTLGIFQSFQSAREANDLVFSALLPIAKRDVVKGKLCFCVFIELCGFAVMAACTVIRMTLLKDAPAYRGNALMTANPFALGMALVIFGLFNLIFVGGFFKTAYKLAKSFVLYIVSAMMTVGIAETAHHIPGLERLNAFGTDALGLQLALLGAGGALFAALSVISCRVSCRRFEKIDL